VIGKKLQTPAIFSAVYPERFIVDSKPTFIEYRIQVRVADPKTTVDKELRNDLTELQPQDYHIDYIV
jgi:hypothetical protein